MICFSIFTSAYAWSLPGISLPVNAGDSAIYLLASSPYPVAGSSVFWIRRTGHVNSLRYDSNGNHVFSQYPSGKPTNMHCLMNISFSTIALSATMHQKDLQKSMMLHFTVFRYSQSVSHSCSKSIFHPSVRWRYLWICVVS